MHCSRRHRVLARFLEDIEANTGEKERGLLHVVTEPIAFNHDDVIKRKHFPHYWPLVRGIHRSPVNSPHKGQWPGALMFSLICAWIKGWVNNGKAGDLRCYRTHYGITIINASLAYLELSQMFSLSMGCIPNTNNRWGWQWQHWVFFFYIWIYSFKFEIFHRENIFPNLISN